MGLFDFLKSKKKRRKKAAGSEADGVMRLDAVDLSGTEPIETRYTQEYQDFLASQEAAAKEKSAASDAETTED